MSGSEHSSSIETDLESVEVPLEGTVVVLVKHQRYSFEPIQVALQRLPVMIPTWVRLQPAPLNHSSS